MKLFFDMDGTLADFNGGGGLEKMEQKGFFLNLAPYANARKFVRNMSKFHEIYILSACIDTDYCMTEKILWLRKNFKFIPYENIILVPYGTNKADAIIKRFGKVTTDYLLFDDYKVNLDQWRQQGGTPIKCGKTYKPSRLYRQNIKFGIELI